MYDISKVYILQDKRVWCECESDIANGGPSLVWRMTIRITWIEMKIPVVGLILQLQYKPQIQGLSERLKKSKDIRRVKMFSSL